MRSRPSPGGRPGCGRVLGDDELRDLGIFFADRRYGELVFLLEPGWLIGGSDFNGHGWTPAGMHGYHPDDPYSDGVFLCSHKPSARVHSIADVHPLMLAATNATSRAQETRS